MTEEKIRGWYELKCCSKLKNNENHKKDILTRIYNEVDEAFYPCKGYRFGSNQTNFIKYILIQVGLENEFWVYANKMKEYENEFYEKQENKINKFKNKEWLYDIHWYKDSIDDFYMPIAFTLAVECEWQYKRHNDKSGKGFSAVKYDFQKLLITNANLKLLIFKAQNITSKDFLDLNLYIENAIKNYPNLKKKSNFLFICFADRRVFYSEKKTP